MYTDLLDEGTGIFTFNFFGNFYLPVVAAGFEPLIFGLWIVCSTTGLPPLQTWIKKFFCISLNISLRILLLLPIQPLLPNLLILPFCQLSPYCLIANTASFAYLVPIDNYAPNLLKFDFLLETAKVQYNRYLSTPWKRLQRRWWKPTKFQCWYAWWVHRAWIFFIITFLVISISLW